MNKLFLFLLIGLLLLLNGCSKHVLSGKKVQTEYDDPSGRVQNKYYLGGNIRSEFIMDDNTLQNGVRIEYGHDGRVLVRMHIKNGVPHGLTTRYYIGGQVLSNEYYKNGKKEGLCEVYYPNGYPKGDLMASYTYKNGMKNGPAQTYNKDGSIYRSVIYKNNKIVH